jgi:hypothetical protein
MTGHTAGASRDLAMCDRIIAQGDDPVWETCHGVCGPHGAVLLHKVTEIQTPPLAK